MLKSQGKPHGLKAPKTKQISQTRQKKEKKHSSLTKSKTNTTHQQQSSLHTRSTIKSPQPQHLNKRSKRVFSTEVKEDVKSIQMGLGQQENDQNDQNDPKSQKSPQNVESVENTLNTPKINPDTLLPLIRGITNPTNWSRTIADTVQTSKLFNSTALIVGGHENSYTMNDDNLFTHDAYLTQHLEPSAIKPDYPGPQTFAQHRHQPGASKIWNNVHADVRHFQFHDFIAMIGSTSIQHPIRILETPPNLLYNPFTYNSKWSHTVFRGMSLPLRLNTGFVGPMVKRQSIHWNHVVRNNLPLPKDPSQSTYGDLALWYNKKIETVAAEEAKRTEEEPKSIRIKVKKDNKDTTNDDKNDEKSDKSDKNDQNNEKSDQNVSTNAPKPDTTSKSTPSGFAVRTETAKIEDEEVSRSIGKKFVGKKSNTTFSVNKVKTPTEFGHYQLPSHIESLILTPWRHDMIRYDLESTTKVANPLKLALDAALFITIPVPVQKYVEQYRPQTYFPDLPTKIAQHHEKIAQSQIGALSNFLKTKRISLEMKVGMKENAVSAGMDGQYPWLDDTDEQSITYCVNIHSHRFRWQKRFNVESPHIADIAELEAFLTAFQHAPPLDHKSYGVGAYVQPENDRVDWTLNALTQLPPMALLTHVVGGLDNGEPYPGHP